MRDVRVWCSGSSCETPDRFPRAVTTKLKETPLCGLGEVGATDGNGLLAEYDAWTEASSPTALEGGTLRWREGL